MESDSLRKLRDVPFYRAPERVQTSGEIVRDARLSLTSQHIGPLPLKTRRPETPLEENSRRLFQQSSAKDLTHRPPSTFRFAISVSVPLVLEYTADDYTIYFLIWGVVLKREVGGHGKNWVDVRRLQHHKYT